MPTLNLICNLSITNNGITASGSTSSTITTTGSEFGQQVVAVSSAATACPENGVTSFGGYWQAKNLDTVATVSVYFDTGGTGALVGTLNPGDVMQWKPSAQFGLKSSTNGTLVAVVATQP